MPHPNPHHLPNLLGALASSVSDELQTTLEDVMGIGGMGPAAVLAVDTWPDCSISFLQGVLRLTHSGTVRVVDSLEKESLLRRGRGSDARTTALQLTEAGKERVGRARAERYRVLTGLVDDLSDDEYRLMDDLLYRALRRGSRTRTEARHACRLCDHTVCRGADCPVGASVHAV